MDYQQKLIEEINALLDATRKRIQRARDETPPDLKQIGELRAVELSQWEILARLENSN